MNELFDLYGTVALVTGASGSLGSRFVRVLADNGARVAACARSPEKLADLVKDIDRAGGDVIPYRLDVADHDGATTVFDQVEADWGPVTLLVNNAGIAHTAPAHEVTRENWDRVLDTDLDAPFFIMQEFARRLIAAETPGAIVNIASLIGIKPEKGVAAYCVAKAGLIHLTRVLALEWARYGIRVNAIAPGYIPTAMNDRHLASEAGEALRKRIPMRRFGKPADLDGALLLLASPAGAYMTGSTLVIDGGLGI